MHPFRKIVPFLFVAVMTVFSQAASYTTISAYGYPTGVYKINSEGVMVGSYEVGNFAHAFVLKGGVITTLNIPGATGPAFANGINDFGKIVGFYQNVGGTHGFLFDAGVYTTIDFPGAVDTQPQGINNAGMIVGSYSLDGVNFYGYEQKGTRFTKLNPARSLASGASGLNNANYVVGAASEVQGGGSWYAYVFNTNFFHILYFPEQSYATAVGINDKKQIVGYYVTPTEEHSFVYFNGRAITTGVPGATYTYNYGINNKGQIVGQYVMSGVYYGFLRTED